MKASKKFLSLLLVLTMVFSFAAISASAEGFLVMGSNNDSEPQSGQNLTDTTGNAAEQDAIIVGGEDSSSADGNKPEETTAPEESKEPEVTDPVAVIVGTKKTYKYASLEEAIAAAAEGATVQLVKDITISKPLTISKNLTLDLAEATVTFKSGTNYDAALVVDSGADVTIMEGELSFAATSDKDGNKFGFVNGIYAEDGSVALVNMIIKGTVIGGSKLANTEDGSISVMIGEFDFDPSAYVTEEFPVSEVDGVYYVTYEPADEGGDDNADDNASIFVVRPDQEGEQMTADATAALNVTESKTIDLNGRSLKDVTVAPGITLRLINTTGSGTVSGNIDLGGNLIIENNITVTGNILMKDNSSLTVKDSTVDVKGDVKLADGASADKVSGIVTAGKFKSVLPGLIPDTHEFKSGAVTEKAPAASVGNTVTDASGNTYNSNTNYLQYFKGETELASEQSIVYLDKAVFKLSGKPSPVKLGSTTLTEGADKDYTWDDTAKTLKFVVKTAAAGTGKTQYTIDAFQKLNAGANEITFEFGSGTPDKVTVPVYVWPSIVTTDIKHVVGDKTDKTVEMSDKPVSVKIGGAEIALAGWYYDANAGKLVLKAAYLDTLSAGDKNISFAFDAASGSEFVSALSIINVTPVEANKDNKWLNSNTALSYNVSHAVDGVKVDGTALATSNYSVSDKNVLSLKADYLKTLSYGEHSLTVTTAGVDVTIKFTTAPSLVPKDATNHTKGGNKDLVFIASDPMNAVWVGKTQLKSDYYTISSDGKTITLKAAFLNTLKADNTYTITTAYVNSGSNTARYSAATSFKILSAASAGATPSTGDTGLGLWIALLVVSGAAIAVLLPKQRREN